MVEITKNTPVLHIYVDKEDLGFRYTHHGVYIGNNEVIHFTGKYLKGEVKKTPLREFNKEEQEIEVFDYTRFGFIIERKQDLWGYFLFEDNRELVFRQVQSFFEKAGKGDQFHHFINKEFQRLRKKSARASLNWMPRSYEFDEDFCTRFSTLCSSINFSSHKAQNALKEINEDKQYRFLSEKEIVKRAKASLGKTDYSLLVNNCEHFAHYCMIDYHHSFQVEKVTDALSSIASLFNIY